MDWLRRDLLSEYFLSRLQYFIPAGFETFEGWIDLNIGNDANILEATTVQGIDPLSGEVKTPSSGQQDSCDVSCCPFSFSTDQSYMVYPLEHHWDTLEVAYEVLADKYNDRFGEWLGTCRLPPASRIHIMQGMELGRWNELNHRAVVRRSHGNLPWQTLDASVCKVIHEPSTKVEARTAVRVAEVEDESAAVPEGLFSNEGLEPPHIYVQEGSKLAKFWLEAVELASSTGYAAHKLTKLRQLVETDQQFFLESWHEFFRS